jgi:hypothetical protein
MIRFRLRKARNKEKGHFRRAPEARSRASANEAPSTGAWKVQVQVLAADDDLVIDVPYAFDGSYKALKLSLNCFALNSAYQSRLPANDANRHAQGREILIVHDSFVDFCLNR